MRLNSPYNVVGIHVGSAYIYDYGNRTSKPLKNARQAAAVMRKAHASIEKYLIQMGVKKEMQDEYYRHEGVFEVPFAMQRDWNLVTGSIEYIDFTDPKSCKFVPLPENCITRDPK